MFVKVLAIVLTLLLVVGIHEAGHLLAASWCKVKVLRFSIGFGRPLFLWESKKGIEWVWGLWPLGGYVQLLDSRLAKVEEKDYVACFDKQSFSKRFFILIAGGLANVILAILALTLFFMLDHVQIKPEVHAILPGSMVAKAGMLPQDNILSIADIPVHSWSEASMQILFNIGKEHVKVQVANPKQEVRTLYLNLVLPAAAEKKELFAALGIVLKAKMQVVEKVEGVPLFTAFMQALHSTGQMLLFFLVMIKLVITGALAFSMLLGPLSIFKVSVHSFKAGISAFVYFIANFSLAVGLVNLLPFPGLDGGSIVYALIEKIRKKPISLALEVLLYRLTLIAFLLFLMELLMNDLRRL